MCVSKRLKTIRCGAMLMGLTLVWALAHADGGEGEQVKRLKLQMRQLQQQQADLQDEQQRAAEEKSKLQATLQSVQSEASTQKAAASSASRRAKALGAEVESLHKERDALNEQVAALQKQVADLSALSKNQAEQLRTLTYAHQSLEKAQAQCVADNAQLYTLGSDLLKRYSNKGLGEVLAAKEPFIQTARVTLENLAADYQDKMDAARFQFPAAKSPSPAP